MRPEVLGLLAACSILAGCGTGARYDPAADARAAMNEAARQCYTRFPEGSKQYVAKARCEYDAAMLMRPYAPYPDLFDSEWAFNMALAEKLQAGKITPAEHNLALAEHRSQIASETQRRGLANRSVAAQESIAAAASAPPPSISCTRVGNNTFCN